MELAVPSAIRHEDACCPADDDSRVTASAFRCSPDCAEMSAMERNGTPVVDWNVPAVRRLALLVIFVQPRDGDRPAQEIVRSVLDLEGPPRQGWSPRDPESNA